MDCRGRQCLFRENPQEMSRARLERDPLLKVRSNPKVPAAPPLKRPPFSSAVRICTILFITEGTDSSGAQFVFTADQFPFSAAEFVKVPVIKFVSTVPLSVNVVLV